MIGLPDAGRGGDPAAGCRKNFNGRNPQMRRDLASALRTRTHDLTPPPPGRRPPRRLRRRASRTARSPGCARELRAHPCHGCPEREDHARWAERWFKLRPRRRRRCKRRVEQRTNTVARQFDRVCDVLTALDYLDGDDGHRRAGATCSGSTPTGPGGRRVAAHGLWDDLTPSELAAALSVLVFEARRPDDASLAADPRRARSRTRSARWCGCGPSWTPWSASTSSTSCASPTSASPGRLPLGRGRRARRRAAAPAELAAGDFVRWMKQLLDLAGQVADAAGDAPLRETAREVVRRLRRGVVAYSGLAD